MASDDDELMIKIRELCALQLRKTVEANIKDTNELQAKTAEENEELRERISQLERDKAEHEAKYAELEQKFKEEVQYRKDQEKTKEKADRKRAREYSVLEASYEKQSKLLAAKNSEIIKVMHTLQGALDGLKKIL